MGKGLLFVFSAPSGAGKSTLIDRIRHRFPEMLYSISCTTRAPRKGESEGIHYYFLDKDTFQGLIEKGGFLEWKEVHGNLYGTPTGPVTAALNSGQSMILDIDVQGAAEVLLRFKDAVGIIISAPNAQVLEQRLRNRGTESEESIHTRLKNAAREMQQAHLFHYRVVNDDLDRATQEIAEIIAGESGRQE
jgi:guanylate kinase